MSQIRVVYRDNNNRQAYTTLRCLDYLPDSALLSVASTLGSLSNAAVVGVTQQITYHVAGALSPDADSDVGRLALVVVGDSMRALYSYLVPSPVQMPVMAGAPDVVDISLLSPALRDYAVDIGNIVANASTLRAIALWR